jgi:dTDP-4-dehydrorhamnose 3,5-epimerase
MKLESTTIDGVSLLHRKIHQDERGTFTRLYADDELAAIGHPTKAMHINTSTSVSAGTLRGIHFQYPPYSETKVVSCVSGAIWDVAVDLRPDSETRFQWFGETLTPKNGTSLIIPEGFGHAFITLEPNSTVVYIVSAPYAIEYESGARFDDPIIGINWPLEPVVMSEKDKTWEMLVNRIDEIDSKFL